MRHPHVGICSKLQAKIGVSHQYEYISASISVTDSISPKSANFDTGMSEGQINLFAVLLKTEIIKR